MDSKDILFYIFFTLLIVFIYRFATVHKDSVMDIPEGLDLEKAAGIPEVWCTAF